MTSSAVLLVDAATGLLQAQLQEQGYQVTLALHDESEVLRLLRAKGAPAYDLIVLRVDQTRLSAERLLMQLKFEHAARPVPLLLLASPDDVAVAERCIALGADDYLIEPASPALLRSRISSCLEVQRLRQAQHEQKELLKFERDIQIGRQIQADFLPDKLPELPGWEIAARFHAARNVSGDFYDSFPMSRGRIGLVIGDVCDKGVGAALFMSLFRSLLRVLAQQTYTTNLLDSLGDPAIPNGSGRRSLPSAGTLALKNAIELTNTYIARTHVRTNMFATIFFGVLDPLTGGLLYVNGGHEAPVIVGPGGCKRRLTSTGLAVGMMPDVEFGIGHALLEPGDMLVCYTDGVPDARNPAGKLYGEPRFLALLEHPEASARAMLDRIETDVYVHIAEADQFDDITMLAVGRASGTETPT